MKYFLTLLLTVCSTGIVRTVDAQDCNHFFLQQDSLKLTGDIEIVIDAPVRYFRDKELQTGVHDRSEYDRKLSERFRISRDTALVKCNGDTIHVTQTTRKSDYIYVNQELTITLNPSRTHIASLRYWNEDKYFTQRITHSFEIHNLLFHPADGRIMRMRGATSENLVQLGYSYFYFATGGTSEGISIIGITDSNHVNLDVYLPLLRVQSQIKQTEVAIWPNPAHSILKLSRSQRYLAIRDQLGRIVHSVNDQQEVNIEDLSPGIYYLEAFAGSELTYHKFVKR